MARLRRADCSQAGITRRRRGRGFEYLDPDGARIGDEETLERIRALAIPPAWEDVWICLDAYGHLQATGIDDAGRKQYLYHQKWREHRDRQKFDEMLEFAKALPKMRERVAADLRKRELTPDKVLACAVQLLDFGLFRIGSEGYAEQNESFGLATIRKDHVQLNGKAIEFDFPAKSGQRRVQSIVEPRVFKIVSELKKRRGGGDELLAYREGRRWTDLTSTDINDYIKSAGGGDFSAKDFRTWNATVLAAVALATVAPARSGNGGPKRTKTAVRRDITDAVKGVAFFLGNTPAVCRASYIDPRVFDRYLSGWTIGGVLAKVDAESFLSISKERELIERGVVDLLEGRKRSGKLEKVAPRIAADSA